MVLPAVAIAARAGAKAATTGARVATRGARRAVGNNNSSQTRGIRNVNVSGRSARRMSAYEGEQYTNYENSTANRYSRNASVDKDFRMKLANRLTAQSGILKNQQNLRRAKRRKTSFASTKKTNPRNNTIQYKRKIKRKKKIGIRERVSRAATKLAANFVNFYIQPILGVYYWFVQLPLALLSLVFLAFATLIAFVTAPDESTWTGYIVGTAVSWTKSALEFFNADAIISILDPTNWLVGMLLIVGGFNMLVFIAVYMSFLIVGSLIPNGKPGSAIQPVFGEQAVNLKFSAFVAVIVCSFMPVVNLIPSLNIWAFVVSRFPR